MNDKGDICIAVKLSLLLGLLATSSLFNEHKVRVVAHSRQLNSFDLLKEEKTLPT